MTEEKLVRMANQIATFFHSQHDADRAAQVAKHLADFWEPRMRKDLFALIERGGAGLDPLVIEAAGRLRAEA